MDPNGVKALLLQHPSTWKSSLTMDSTFQSKLPFQVERMFPTPNGLLIQRLPGLHESLSKTPLPILFTINHPLHDFHPLVLRSSPRLPQGATFFTVESKYQVVGVIKDWSIVVLYSSSTKAHSLWLLRPVCDEELEATTIWNSCGWNSSGWNSSGWNSSGWNSCGAGKQ